MAGPQSTPCQAPDPLRLDPGACHPYPGSWLTLALWQKLSLAAPSHPALLPFTSCWKDPHSHTPHAYLPTPVLLHSSADLWHLGPKHTAKEALTQRKATVKAQDRWH